MHANLLFLHQQQHNSFICHIKHFKKFSFINGKFRCHFFIETEIYFRDIYVNIVYMCSNNNNNKHRCLTCINNHINKIHAFCESVTQIDMMERYNAAFTLSAIQRLASLECFVTTHLILIKLSEIINNDRNGQCDYQYAANTTYWSNNFPERSCRTDIAILYICNMIKL